MMSGFLSALLLFVFFLQSYASPWGPFGALKRALGDGQQLNRRGERSEPPVYGQWSSASMEGSPQTTGWDIQTATTTVPLWTTTAPQGGGEISWKTSTAYEKTERYKTRTVTETPQETCSVASPSTIFTTIISTIQPAAETVFTTVTETETGAGATVVQQVLTTILSTIVSTSAGSCTPVSPVRSVENMFSFSHASHLRDPTSG